MTLSEEQIELTEQPGLRLTGNRCCVLLLLPGANRFAVVMGTAALFRQPVLRPQLTAKSRLHWLPSGWIDISLVSCFYD